MERVLGRVRKIKGGGPQRQLLINAEKQGKHIMGHNNYEGGNSILTHPDPQGLLDAHAGTGVTVRGTRGLPGHVEVAEVGKSVGIYFREGVEIGETTRLKIHYDGRGGAHVVPAPPISPTIFGGSRRL